MPVDSVARGGKKKKKKEHNHAHLKIWCMKTRDKDSTHIMPL